VVAEHHLRRAHHQLADLALRQHRHLVVQADDARLHVGEGHADGTFFIEPLNGVAV
jgi:hypothetical protein